jgi:hypothetical protein
MVKQDVGAYGLRQRIGPDPQSLPRLYSKILSWIPRRGTNSLTFRVFKERFSTLRT